MANMFSGNLEKKIPRNFKECYETDSITRNLWSWCEWLEKWGKILFWVLIIGGLILSIFSSIVEKEVIVREASYYSDAETEIRKTFNFEFFLSSLFDTALYAFLEYLAYHLIALLIGSLATIVQHTKITANITLYNSAKAEGISDDYEGKSDEEPKETVENDANNLEQNNFSEILSKIPDSNIGSTWECKNCGSKNPQNSISCKTCGNYK